MTHSLHRAGSPESLQRDFVFLMISALGFNEKGAKDKFIKFNDIIMKYNPVNAGNGRLGNLYKNSGGKLMTDNMVDRMCFHAVFRDSEIVSSVIKELKEADLGLSVVVSGLFDHVGECCNKAGVTRHTIEYSLGRWGKTELLPPEDLLPVHSMCGHALISVNLIKDMLEDVRSGRRTALEAAKPCVCGIFNTERAAEILEQLARDN